MENPLKYLQQRQGEDWLLGYDREQFYLLTHDFYQQFIKLSTPEKPAKILLASTDTLQFIASFTAAVTANCHVFLCNPNWKSSEWEQVWQLVKPDLIIGVGLPFYSVDNSLSSPPVTGSGLIMIPTGGSSGKIRFVMHTWETLTASAKGFYKFFNEQTINSFCVLPLYHVSGLMQFIRSLITGGKLIIMPYKQLKQTINYDVDFGFDKIDLRNFFLSLVPTQLQLLITKNPTWLSQFKTVLIGGAPAWTELLDAARKQKIKIALTYGMTETASGIAILRTNAFLQGNYSCGEVLPHAKVRIENSHQELSSNSGSGIIQIKTHSLYLGYYPQLRTKSDFFTTDDLGYFDNQGYLHITGRYSKKIISGGENIFPQEVETAILATKLVKDVCVIGLPDNKWGEVVTAIYVPQNYQISLTQIKTDLADKLSKFKQPKHWIAIEFLPRNLQGKLNHKEIQAIATKRLTAETFHG